MSTKAEHLESARFRQDSALALALRGLELAAAQDGLEKLGLALGKLRPTTGQSHHARNAFEQMAFILPD